MELLFGWIAVVVALLFAATMHWVHWRLRKAVRRIRQNNEIDDAVLDGLIKGMSEQDRESIKRSQALATPTQVKRTR